MLIERFLLYWISVWSFDDTNLRTLWGTTGARHGDGYIFNFDSSCVDWRLYLFNTHIPAVLKVAADMKKQGRAWNALIDLFWWIGDPLLHKLHYTSVVTGYYIYVFESFSYRWIKLHVDRAASLRPPNWYILLWI
jgi:hypothetical protein